MYFYWERRNEGFMFFLYICAFIMPVLGIVFCVNLVEVLKKIKKDEKTAKNTFWLTISFMLMMWSIGVAAAIGVN